MLITYNRVIISLDDKFMMCPQGYILQHLLEITWDFLRLKAFIMGICINRCHIVIDMWVSLHGLIVNGLESLLILGHETIANCKHFKWAFSVTLAAA